MPKGNVISNMKQKEKKRGKNKKRGCGTCYCESRCNYCKYKLFNPKGFTVLVHWKPARGIPKRITKVTVMIQFQVHFWEWRWRGGIRSCQSTGERIQITDSQHQRESGKAKETRRNDSSNGQTNEKRVSVSWNWSGSFEMGQFR